MHFNNISKLFLSSAMTQYDSSAAVVTDSVSSISKAMSEYGPLIVIMAVFVVIFILLVMLMLRNNAKMVDQMIKKDNNSFDTNQSNQELIKKIVESSLEINRDESKNELEDILKDLKRTIEDSKSSNNDNKNRQKDDDSFDYHMDIAGAFISVNEALKNESKKAISELECSRIGIYEFHNGNSSLYGLPFFKMSCIHEISSRGGYPTLRGKNHINLPLHMFDDFIYYLWTHGYYITQDISKSSEEYRSLEEFTKYSNVKSLFIKAIKNTDGFLAGFVVAEYEYVDTFEEDESRKKFINDVLDNMIKNISPFVASKYIFRGNKPEQ